MGKKYVPYHIHSDYSLLDSCTKFKEYVDKCVELGYESIASTEHGNVYNWVEKKLYCDNVGIKYIHGCEVYLTELLYHTNPDGSTYKIRDNYHTILLARNLDGVKELNELISISNDKDHFYFKPRLSFDEFLCISNNIIKTSACLASPLNKKNLQKTRDIIQLKYNEVLEKLNSVDENISEKDLEILKRIEYNISEELNYNFDAYEKIARAYDFLEIQPHINSDDQKDFNVDLISLHNTISTPLIVGTDTHSIDKYKAECRSILQKSKRIEFTNEDEFDLTFKTYEEITDMFKEQGVLKESIYVEALENTNKMAALCENFELDVSIKYPHMYEDDEKIFEERVWKMLDEKIKSGIIPSNQIDKFKENIIEEIRVFKKVDMCGFMLSMSEIMCWCRDNGIPTGPNRGSVGGSCVAYVTNVTDLNPVQWGTIFSRFCNEDRVEVGDYIMVSAA